MKNKIKVRTSLGNTVSVLPCPYCGNNEYFYIGHESFDTMMISCRYWDEDANAYGCGASIQRQLWPSSEMDEEGRFLVEPKGRNFKERQKWFERRAIRKCVDAWNKRSTQ